MSAQRPPVPSVFPNDLVQHDSKFVIVYDANQETFVLHNKEFCYPNATFTEEDSLGFHSTKLASATGELISEYREHAGDCQQITMTFAHGGELHKATYVNGSLIQ